MALARNTGYAPNGDQIPGNELPDILLNYKAYLNGEKLENTDLCTWICNVDDRLDAKFYYKQDEKKETKNLSLIENNIVTLLTDIT